MPAPQHVRVDAAVQSPYFDEVALVVYVGGRGYLQVGQTGETKLTIYSSYNACCSNLIWTRAGLLVFDDDYIVRRIDVGNCVFFANSVRRCPAQTIAGFSNFVISPDGKWVAGWADNGGHGPETLRVVSINGADCRAVPRHSNESDSDPLFVDRDHLQYSRSVGTQEGVDWTDTRPEGVAAVNVFTLPHAKHC